MRLYHCGYFFRAAAACGDLNIFSPAAVNEDLPVQIYRILPVNIQQIAGPRGTYMKYYAERFLCGILLILSVAIVYKSFKKTRLRFGEYLIKVFHNVMKSLTIWLVLELCGAFLDSFLANYLFYEYYFEYGIQVRGRFWLWTFFGWEL